MEKTASAHLPWTLFPPCTVIAGVAACPLKCSCMLELSKQGGQLGCILLRNQRRRMAVEMAVKSKRKKIMAPTFEYI